MSFNSTSPTNYGFEGDPSMEAYMNAKFSEEISEKMKVPKRLTANGHEMENEILNGNQMNSWNYYEKHDMTVPDRIVVIGQDQHMGTKSAPREIMLENSILPKETGFVRVSTPPRVITLENHHFPSANDEPEREEDYDDGRYFEPKNLDFGDGKKGHRSRKINSSEIVINHREETPQFGSGVGSVENLSTAPQDEVLHLRKQVAKLNRRLLNVEIDNLQRTQREKIICAFGVAYFVLKAFFWLNRK